ncbi:unnamed protein product, partial [Ectocarpus fasciculatus]
GGSVRFQHGSSACFSSPQEPGGRRQHEQPRDGDGPVELLVHGIVGAADPGAAVGRCGRRAAAGAQEGSHRSAGPVRPSGGRGPEGCGGKRRRRRRHRRGGGRQRRRLRFRARRGGVCGKEEE